VAASGGWEQWEWDQSLFAGAAGYYEQGRLPYAPGLADALADEPAWMAAGLGRFRVVTFGASFHST
jgi:hypothetical protein